MSAPDLFTPTESTPTSPEQSGPVLDWQEQPARTYPDGTKRPQYVWPTNYGAKQTRNMGRKLDEYREKKQNDKRAPRLFDKTARQIAADMDDEEKGAEV